MRARVVRVVVMPQGQRVSLGNYVRAWRVAKANPAHLFADRNTVRCFGGAVTGAEAVRFFRAAMHDRINEQRPYVERGTQ